MVETTTHIVGWLHGSIKRKKKKKSLSSNLISYKHCGGGFCSKLANSLSTLGPKDSHGFVPSSDMSSF